MPEIRPMRPDDVPFALELCRLACWNQLEGDWQRLLALEPEGVFVAEDNGQRCGTASITTYGTRTAWIGMILVHPAARRRGIGSALMSHCIRTLQARGVRSIKLDATDQGRPVYLKLGFQDERPIHRYAGQGSIPAETGAVPRPIDEGDWPAIARLDATAFGADRMALLRRLACDGPSAVVGDGGVVRAFGFARPGCEAGFLGPVVATDAEAAGGVVRRLMSALPGGRIFCDVLPENLAAAALAESLGLTVSRRLTRMVLGDTMNPGCVGHVWAAAGFELG
jgi:GNAT superfamily N-acetyltransferase